MKLNGWADIKEKIDYIPGMLHPGQGEWLYQIARGLPDHATILEVGAWKGKSTACLAFGCAGSHKRVFTIDTFDGTPEDTNVAGECFLSDFLCNMESLDVLSHVTPLVGKSEFYYPVWNKWAKQIDFLWIDGCHLYQVVKADMDAFFRWLKPGGVLAMHDVWGDTGGDGADRAWFDYLDRIDSVHHEHNLAWGRKV